MTRPADLAGAPLRDLVEGYRLHVAALVNARHGVGRPEPVGRLRASALDALTIAAAIAAQLAGDRWSNVVDALRLDASLEHVATAMGLEVDEVAAGLRSWADGQHQHAGMTAAARDEVYALAGGYLTAGEVAALDAEADRRLGAEHADDEDGGER
ncbi:hypothetical protein CFP66_06695 [Pseudonocardia sp. MH-G8]|nr:hypothetical protein CFP66_06695 [Pseudonocardia sp. MH-G8]